MLTMATANKRKSERLFLTPRSATSTSSLYASYGSDLDIVLDDRKIRSDPHGNRNRRTIVIIRENGSFGFTLQSYGLRRVGSVETDLLSYVDYVELGGPAYKAGMREGDVILSINGKSMEGVDHETLVDCIKCCEDSMRMVVMFEDVRRKIELHLRYLKLKQVLETKRVELRSLAEQETRILQKVGACGGDDVNILGNSESSSVFGSIYFSCGSDSNLIDRNTSSSSVFQSAASLSQAVDSPDGGSLNLSAGMVFTPTQNVEIPTAGSSHDLLPPMDDAFWSSNFGYGSLPIRSQKRNAKSGSAAKRTASVRHHNHNRPVVNSTLHEEGDESNDSHSITENQMESTGSCVINQVTSVNEIPPAANFVSPKLKDKKSTSVPNLIKLKFQNSPFLARRLFSVQTQRSRGHDESDLRISIVHDPRTMTKQLRQEISNYVITEDLDRRSDDPQLLGLRQLCNDFRFGMFQESLKQRRKSIELKTTKDPSGKQFPPQKKTGFQLSKHLGSFRSRPSRKLSDSDDLRRQLHDLSRGETVDETKVSKSVNPAVEDLDKRITLHRNYSNQSELGIDQKQHLSNYNSNSVVELNESQVARLEIIDESVDRSDDEKVVSTRPGVAQFVSSTDEVTKL